MVWCPVWCGVWSADVTIRSEMSVGITVAVGVCLGMQDEMFYCQKIVFDIGR